MLMERKGLNSVRAQATFGSPSNGSPVVPKRRRVRVIAASSPTLEDDLARARDAWVRYRSTRRRSAVYGYLATLADIVKDGRCLDTVPSASLR